MNDINIKDSQSRLNINSTIPFRSSIQEQKINHSYNFNRFEIFWDLDELTPGKTVTAKLEIKV